MDKNKLLDEIFNNDPLRLLAVKPKTANVKTAEQRLIASFAEINDFIRANDREPEPNTGNISEYQLYTRLKSLREDVEKMEILRTSDVFNLLFEPTENKVRDSKPSYQRKPKEINSIDDILADDSLGILGNDDEGLFDLKHIPKETTMPDYVAKRKPCKDFADFEHLFITCQADLANAKRRLLPFRNEQQIESGYFFVLKGILLYVAEVGKREPDENGKINARLRCIFENGTESDMLLRSLAAELYKDGKRVTEHDDRLLDHFNNITTQDKEAGYIYVLSSKSDNPKIAGIKNLFKIGYSSSEVAERIKNAEKEPTYLMAPVKYIAGWKCYNMNTQKFEQLIHNFFGNSCLELDVFDEKGKRHTPREWFIAPLPIIEQAIELIITGEIVNYKYDKNNSCITQRKF